MRTLRYLAVLLLLATPAKSQSLYVARVPGFGPYSAEQQGGSVQETEVWCWAASIQTILRHYGINRSQATIVQATYGVVGNLPARDPAVYVPMLNGMQIGNDGIDFTQASMPMTWISSQALATELNTGHPVLVWHRSGPNSAHVVVLFEAGFYQNGIPAYYRYWDPYPGRGYQTVNAQAFNQIAMAFNLIRGAHVVAQSTSADNSKTTPAVAADSSDSDDADLMSAVESLADKAESGRDALEDLRDERDGSSDGVTEEPPGASCHMSKSASLRGWVSCTIATYDKRVAAMQRYDTLLPQVSQLLSSKGWTGESGNTGSDTIRARVWRNGTARIDLELNHYVSTDFDVDMHFRGSK